MGACRIATDGLILARGVDKVNTRLIRCCPQGQVGLKTRLTGRQMTVVKVEANAEWKCVRAKGGNWVAVCDPLGLTIQSETWATLMEDIAQALNAMFIDLLESNELERFLRDHGWRSIGLMPEKAADVWFDVPFVSRPIARDKQVAVH